MADSTNPSLVECGYCATEFTPYEGDTLVTCPRCEKAVSIDFGLLSLSRRSAAEAGLLPAAPLHNPAPMES